VTWLRAGALRLTCRLAPQWPAGAGVCWMVPTSGVRLRALMGDQLPAGHNRVSFRVRTMVALGDEVHLTAGLPGIERPLHLQVSQRLAAALCLEPGMSTDAMLRPDSLHILARE